MLLCMPVHDYLTLFLTLTIFLDILVTIVIVQLTSWPCDKLNDTLKFTSGRDSWLIHCCTRQKFFDLLASNCKEMTDYRKKILQTWILQLQAVIKITASHSLLWWNILLQNTNCNFFNILKHVNIHIVIDFSKSSHFCHQL